MTGETTEKLTAAQELIQRFLPDSVLAVIGQELYAAYVGATAIMRENIDRSAFRETAPHLLRGMIETALKNLGQNLSGANCVTETNARKTSSHNELQIGNRLILSAARCNKRTGKSRPAGYRRAHSVQNSPFMYPELLEIPDVKAGAKLNGYLEHLPNLKKPDEVSILRIVFPTPDYLSEIAVIDLEPYFLAAMGNAKPAEATRSVPEIEEDHVLELVEVQKTE
ncbi:hypothetical protein [Deinococcus humi]|uniref:Uncharacterized protein n=1 Tax=Deinococcus humi TaxID=662880 RepID=A0A7W8JUI9_9DEIO|nr:hypothetical protein [Deinococcus humi]MBB5362051.1 hypothetical protein [Deinococcus humi]